MRFLDTSVLLYAVSPAQGDADRQRIARELLDNDDLALSTQVLQEFYVQSTCVSRPDPLRPDQAVNLIEAWMRFFVQPVTKEIVQASLSACRRWSISYWDAAIVEAARAAGCPVLLTEDLQHGMDFAGVWVENPFRNA